MARYVAEETVEVFWVTTVSDAAAPTSTELNAGVDITAFLTGDLELPFEGSAVDAADMSSKFNKTIDGDYGGQPGSFTIHKELASGDDTAFTTLARSTAGYLAVAPRGLATSGTWAISDEVDLFPCTVLSRTTQYARNTSVRAAIQVAITGTPTEEFALVA
jgi:hypothetical protein